LQVPCSPCKHKISLRVGELQVARNFPLSIIYHLRQTVMYETKWQLRLNCPHKRPSMSAPLVTTGVLRTAALHDGNCYS
jgi:hypothetical protein